MASQIKRTKTTPRVKPGKPRGVPSKGLNAGAKRTNLSEVQKVLMGKGKVHRQAVGTKGNGTSPTRTHRSIAYQRYHKVGIHKPITQEEEKV